MARKKQSVRAAERAQELQKKRKAQEDARAAKRRRLEQGGLDEPPAVPEPPAGWATCQRFADPPAAVTERLSKMLGDELCFDEYAAWDPASLRLLAKAGASKTKAVAEAAVSAARAKEEGRRSSPQSVRRTVEAIFKNAQHVSGASTLQKEFLDALVNPKWERPWDAALGAALLSYAAGAEVTEEEVNAHATLTGGALVVTKMCHEIAFEAVNASRDAFSLSGYRYSFGESEFKEDWAKADWDSREDSDDGLNRRVRPHHVFNAVRQEDVLRAIFLPGLCSGEGAEESKEGEAKADVEAMAFSRHLELESGALPRGPHAAPVLPAPMRALPTDTHGPALLSPRQCPVCASGPRSCSWKSSHSMSSTKWWRKERPRKSSPTSAPPAPPNSRCSSARRRSTTSPT